MEIYELNYRWLLYFFSLYTTDPNSGILSPAIIHGRIIQFIIHKQHYIVYIITIRRIMNIIYTSRLQYQPTIYIYIYYITYIYIYIYIYMCVLLRRCITCMSGVTMIIILQNFMCMSTCILLYYTFEANKFVILIPKTSKYVSCWRYNDNKTTHNNIVIRVWDL